MSLDELIADEPFSYFATRKGLVYISYRGKRVTTLGGRDAARFLNKAEGMDRAGLQLAMAKATGHFKHGTERAPRPENNDESHRR